MCFQVNSAWETLNKTWKERVEGLEDAMQAAVQFQDGLQVLQYWYSTELVQQFML